MYISDCNHTWCIDCLYKLVYKKCPFCRNKLEIDYSLYKGVIFINIITKITKYKKLEIKSESLLNEIGHITLIFISDFLTKLNLFVEYNRRWLIYDRDINFLQKIVGLNELKYDNKYKHKYKINLYEIKNIIYEIHKSICKKNNIYKCITKKAIKVLINITISYIINILEEFNNINIEKKYISIQYEYFHNCNLDNIINSYCIYL